MPSRPVPASSAVAQLLRDRRQALGLTLREVAARSRRNGNLIPHSTLARIEHGLLDPGVRRLGQLLELYQLPIQAAGEVLELESLAKATPFERDPEKLRLQALDAWRGGRIGEAIASFLAFRRRVPNDDAHKDMREEAILSFAVAAASLGRLHLSRHLLDELILGKPVERLLLSILLQESVVWLSLGSTVAARAFVERAPAYVRPGAPRHQGWIEHQRALIHIEEGEFTEARACLARALGLHRKAKAPHDELLALLSVVRLEFAEDHPREALRVAERAASLAARHKFNRIRLSALVDKARALQALDEVEESKKVLRAVLADAMVQDDNVTRFFAHYYLWRAEESGGDGERALVELREASYFVKFVDQTSQEAAHVRRSGDAERETG